MKSNIPELRFPEFKNEPEWEEKKLKDICQMQAGKFVSASEINEKNINDSLYPCYGGNGLRGYTKSYTHDGKYSLIGRQGALCGNITFASNKFHATEHAVVVTQNEHIDLNWLFYKLIHLNLNQYATGQAQPGLSVENLERVKVEIPKEEKEQQKIADCLSSLDNLITAQSKKVETLKEHKKGLMQQLFPQESEEVPKLRFPEFKNAPEWEVKPLEKIGEITTGKTPSTSDETLWNGNIRFITPTDIDDDIKYQHNTSRTVVKQPSMKILKVGTITYTCIASIGKIAITTAPSITNQQINSITVYENINNEFVYYALLELTSYIKSKLANTTLPIINKTEFSKFEIKLPKPNEQQKIADCLSSIDNLITAQNKKVEALKEHKKGLMQKLFPSNEVER